MQRRRHLVWALAVAGCAAPDRRPLKDIGYEQRTPAWEQGVHDLRHPPAPHGASSAVDGASLALHSVGHAAGKTWVLDANGIAGTYLRADAAAAVTVAVHALGPAGPCRPQLGIAVGDERVGFAVAAGEGAYRSKFNVPAGTHLLRLDLPNVDCGKTLTIAGVEIWGAEIVN